MRLRILTKEVLSGIPVLVQQGMDADAIAARLGCKVSTLKVRCSQAQISLRVPQEVKVVPLVPAPKPPKPPKQKCHPSNRDRDARYAPPVSEKRSSEERKRASSVQQLAGVKASGLNLVDPDAKPLIDRHEASCGAKPSTSGYVSNRA